MKTILASNGFTMQRDGPLVIVNDRKFALFANIKGSYTLLLLHGPANRFGSEGIGVWLPVPIFKWWKAECLKGSLLSIAAQCKKTDSRYTLHYDRLTKVRLPIVIRSGLRYVVIPLTAFIWTKAPFVKPPRKKRK